ncbi:MAG: hypothetical protein H0V51_11715 [Chloroflexi bacterium]|nr:hypothetical protein [Chloroflexota bacterium]
MPPAIKRRRPRQRPPLSLNVRTSPDSGVCLHGDRPRRERVRAAIRNSRLVFPPRRITVNLAPAELRKSGSLQDYRSGYDVYVSPAQRHRGGGAILDRFPSASRSRPNRSSPMSGASCSCASCRCTAASATCRACCRWLG